MDWITHAALGALIGELMMGKRLGKRALAWGGLLGILPLLDVLIFPLLDTAQKLAWHRGPSHSLLVMALGSWGIAHGLAKIWRRQKITKPHAGLFVAAVWSAQLLLASFTVGGAAISWPLSGKRVTLNLLPEMDLLFTIPLVASVLWLVVLGEPKGKKPRGKTAITFSKRTKLCYYGLGISAGYVLLAGAMKFAASAGFDADLARRKIDYQRRMESPSPFNILLWRSVVDRESELWVGYRSVFEGSSTPVHWTIYPKGRDALAGVEEMPETQRLKKITDGWWIARPHAKGGWLGDLRFAETRIWGSKKGMVDSRLARSWVINSTATGDPLRQISPERAVSSDSMLRMWGRTFGYRENWDANPRLAGVPGSLPEFLAVEQ